jgi:pimeloyl-ACP methyl ester carboxylesterase
MKAKPASRDHRERAEELLAGIACEAHTDRELTTAALVAAAARPGPVAAVVSRGGRPDLAFKHLRSVSQPVLLIVGARDTAVIELNRRAMQELKGKTRLEIVPGASHLFEEPGTLERVARLARGWFTRHLQPVPGENHHSGRTTAKG